MSTDVSFGGTKSFPAQFFAESLPQTSWDMITRLPGFTFSAGDESVRGYSGSAGNVLIDGQRSASKYQDLEGILRRIPASSVERIDLISGRVPEIDMQGHLVVANIIRIHMSTVEMRVDAGVDLVSHLGSFPNGKAEAARSWDDKRLEGSVHVSRIQDDDDSGEGFRSQVTPDGAWLRDASALQQEIEFVVQATMGYEQDVLGGNLRLNADYWSEDEVHKEEIEEKFPDSFLSQVNEQKETHRLEFGGDFEQDLSSGSHLNVIAIQQFESQDEHNFAQDPENSALFLQNNESGESILRAVVQQPHNATTRFEWGAEVAFNFLSSLSKSFENGQMVTLPSADVRVEERRAEPFAKVNWDIRPSLSLRAGGAVEFSEISQSGDRNLSKSLSYIKPSALLTWTPSERNQYRLKLERQVGQLDFNDFVSSAEFSTGTINAGNPELEPFTSWDFTATWVHQFAADAASVLTLHHAQISDVVDLVPIYTVDPESGETGVFDGPGNIGAGWLTEAELSLNLPFDRWGIKGGLIKANLIYRDSSVTDPLTQQKRSISGYIPPWEGSLEWFQDLPDRNFRWGANVSLSIQSPSYRLDETRVYAEHGWLGMFAEYNPSERWSVRAEAQNLTGREVRLTRTLYDAPRDTGEIDSIKVQSIDTYPFLYLQLSWRLN
ncbi:MAG TPA: TonB-dependent receptor [Woeseiaceae bacterium]|nr:TonB-dependent receptor [Woeseiaceae bacterium]